MLVYWRLSLINPMSNQIKSSYGPTHQSGGPTLKVIVALRPSLKEGPTKWEVTLNLTGLLSRLNEVPRWSGLKAFNILILPKDSATHETLQCWVDAKLSTKSHLGTLCRGCTFSRHGCNGECGLQSSWENRKFLAVLGSACWFFTGFHHAFTMLLPNCWALQSGSLSILPEEVSTLVTARHSAVSFKPFALLIGGFNACKKTNMPLGIIIPFFEDKQ